MRSFTEEELRKIIAWQPYRPDWPVDRNLVDDRIDEHFGDLLNFFNSTIYFRTYISEDGGISNYLGIICYPENVTGEQKAILFCISLCAPVAAYREIPVWIHTDGLGSGFLQPENAGNIESEELKVIESIVLPELEKNGIRILSSEVLSEELSPEIYEENLSTQSLHEGNQLLHAIFQVMD